MSAIYKTFWKGEAVYIGQSKSVEGAKGRVRNHNYRFYIDEHTIEECPSDLVNDVEAVLIAKYKPRYNMNLPRNSELKGLRSEIVGFHKTICDFSVDLGLGIEIGESQIKNYICTEDIEELHNAIKEAFNDYKTKYKKTKPKASEGKA